MTNKSEAEKKNAIAQMSQFKQLKRMVNTYEALTEELDTYEAVQQQQQLDHRSWSHLELEAVMKAVRCRRVVHERAQRQHQHYLA